MRILIKNAGWWVVLAWGYFTLLAGGALALVNWVTGNHLSPVAVLVIAGVFGAAGCMLLRLAVRSEGKVR